MPPFKGDRTLAQLAEQLDVHPNQITSWRAQLEEGAADVFGSGGGNGGVQPAVDVKSLHAKIRELTLPFAGSPMLQRLLVAEGCKIGRRHVKTLMQRMGIEALYRRPRTTKPEPGHKIYPYLLRGATLTRPNQVWAMDITYIPMGRGLVDNVQNLSHFQD